MTTRSLPRAEWPRLAGTELEAVWPYLPAGAEVIAVEDDGQIVGCWAVFPLVHVEGIWIAPEHRGRGSVARRLLGGMRRAARAMGARAVNTAATSAEVAAMLEKLGGVELRGRHFAVTIKSED
jgi:N-acetylglutamate synthase-like GNAT family acetyltransferase